MKLDVDPQSSNVFNVPFLADLIFFLSFFGNATGIVCPIERHEHAGWQRPEAHANVLPGALLPRPSGNLEPPPPSRLHIDTMVDIVKDNLLHHCMAATQRVKGPIVVLARFADMSDM